MDERIVFLDTSGIFAWINQRDPNHQTMLALPHEPGCRLVTTDYILDEALTLFMARGIPHQRKRLLSMVNTSAIVQLVWIGQDYFREAAEWMFKYDDHPFSFTDCTSFACMAKLGIRKVATTDAHFEKVGFTNLLRNPT
jgi:predicted nucleic acid-binding protein